MRRAVVWGAVVSVLTYFASDISGADPQLTWPGAKKWALLVGVDEFAFQSRLKYAHRDVELLRNRLLGAGFQDVVALHDKNATIGQRPIQRVIESELQSLISRVGKDDLVLFFFTGHGCEIDGHGYLCPADGRPDTPETLLRVKTIYDLLAKCPTSRKLVFIDACRNRFSSNANPKMVRLVPESRDAVPDKLSELAFNDGLSSLTSCRSGQVSWESEQLEHGLFLYHVVKGMDGWADVDGDRNGRISYFELFRYAFVNTRMAAEEIAKHNPAAAFLPDRGKQVPAITMVDGEDIDFGLVTIINSAGIKLRYIPPGNGMLGSEGDEKGDQDETPRRVFFLKPLLVSVYEVTQLEFDRVMAAAPESEQTSLLRPVPVTAPATEGVHLAATNVSWHKAKEFCEKLTRLDAEQRAHRKYRLLEETEWEYVCRAGTLMPFSCGLKLSPDLCNYESNFDAIGKPGFGKVTPVGKYSPNAWGLFDVHGNVWEWCDSELDPGSKVIRGGGFKSNASECRSAFRGQFNPSRGRADVGFRIVCELPDRPMP